MDNTRSFLLGMSMIGDGKMNLLARIGIGSKKDIRISVWGLKSIQV